MLKKTPLTFFFSLLVLVMTLSGVVRAESQYVTNELTITVRSGQDSSYRVLGTASSGQELEVLSTNSETGYSRVRLGDGTEGYALTRYLTSEEPPRMKIQALQEQVSQLEAETQTDTRQQLEQLRSDYQSLKLKYDTLEFENVQLTQRMEAVKENAANVVSVMEERDEALQRANRLSTELDELQVRTMELENNSEKKWFMAGAGVLVLGILVGIILPRIRTRRRSGWHSGDLSL